jgi:hypothetical protein
MLWIRSRSSHSSAPSIAIPYEMPKLAVVATIGEGFGERMKEIARLKGRSTVIDASATYTALSPSHSEK